MKNTKKEILELIDKLEKYDFWCEAGPITSCKDWIRLKDLIDKLG